jgi:hypothetical protein
MKNIFAIGLLVAALIFLCGGSALAQDQTINRLAWTGAGYFDGAQVKGLAGFVKQLGTGSQFYSVTELQVGMVAKGFGNIGFTNQKDLQADFSSGILYNVGTYKSVTLFGLGEPGLQQTGDNPTAMLKAGGGLHKFIYQNKVGLALFGTWKYAEDPMLKVYQWKVNPAFALTYRF